MALRVYRHIKQLPNACTDPTRTLGDRKSLPSHTRRASGRGCLAMWQHSQVMAALRNTVLTLLRICGYTHIAKAFLAARPTEALKIKKLTIEWGYSPLRSGFSF